MSRAFTQHDLKETCTTSSIAALTNECLHMGWPLDPSQGREEVGRFLSNLGFALNDPGRPIDLYAALNTVRQACWSDSSDLWARYVESRRANVERMSEPQTVCLTLARTFSFNASTATHRVRLPLPISHASQSNMLWTIRSSSLPVIEMREHPGALDVKVAGGATSCRIEVEYRADLTPQSKHLNSVSSGEPLTGITSPFLVPNVIVEQLEDLRRESSVELRLQRLWRLFLDRLVSGHVHHSSRASKGVHNGVGFDCVIGSWTFAQCAESLGIPARVLSGVILNDFGPSPHFWCEVCVNGEWLPVDLYGWDLSHGDSLWGSRFFLSLECRLRFELYPDAFSRFLPNIPWFIERKSEGGSTIITYRCERSGQMLAEDAWTLTTP